MKLTKEVKTTVKAPCKTLVAIYKLVSLRIKEEMFCQSFSPAEAIAIGKPCLFALKYGDFEKIPALGHRPEKTLP